VGKIENFSDERFDFEPSPVDPLKLMLLIKDAVKTFEAQNG